MSLTLTRCLLLAFAVLILLASHASCHSFFSHSWLSGETDDAASKPSPVLQHRCIHDELQEQRKRDGEILFEHHKRGTVVTLQNEATDWQPFRVLVAEELLTGDSGTCYNVGDTVPYYGTSGSYTCTAADVLSSSKRTFLVNNMLGAAVTKFHSLLMVDRLLQPGNLLIPGTTSCITSGTGRPAVNIPASYMTGIDADYLLLVTTRPIPSDGGGLRTLAYATSCDAKTTLEGRIIAGWANFDPSAITPDDDNQLALQVGVAIHEISHALGFSYNLFNALGLTSAGPPYKFVAPLVVDYVRNHFGCPGLDGALLENDGGGGTANSHWEKAAFMNEYMTGTASVNPVMTALTMLAFESTGWYKAVLNNTDSLVFGLNGGCGMSSSWTGCSEWPSSYRCDPATSLGSKCTIDLSAYGKCVTEPSGGLIGSGCTFINAETSCIFPVAPDSTRATQRNQASSRTGQSFAEDSRCFESTLNKVSGLTTILPVPSPSSPSCYRVHCSSTVEPRLSVDGIWYPCKPQGNKIPATGFGGAITCSPDTDKKMCQLRSYDPDWPRVSEITPKRAKPGSEVEVTYSTEFNDTDIIVRVEKDLDGLVYGNGTATGKIAPTSFWQAPKFFSVFNRKVNVIVRDSSKRSDVLIEGFQPDVPLSLMWILIIAGISLLVFILLCVCIYCCCCKKKKKKPTKMQYADTYNRGADDYYYDEDLDDRTRHRPPKAIV